MRELLRVERPMELRSAANLRLHWSERARRAKTHRLIGYTLMRSAIHATGNPFFMARLGDIEIELTRMAPRRLDSDNNVSAFKSIRDGVADALEIDDGDEHFLWTYRQESVAKKNSGIRVRVLAMSGT